jgi:hypothetical protein
MDIMLGAVTCVMLSCPTTRRIRFKGSRSPSNLGDPAVDEDLAPRHEAALVGSQERDDLRCRVITTGAREGVMVAA